MDMLVGGTGGASFTSDDEAASVSDAAQGASCPANQPAPKPSGGSSLWDDAMGAVHSVAGHFDDAMHAAGHAMDGAAQGALDTATGVVRDVAGNTAANAVHSVGEAAIDNVKQDVGFASGAGAGAVGAVRGMVQGTAGLVRDGAKMVNDPAYRSQVIDGAEKLATNVATHPLATAEAAGSSVVQGGEDWLRGAGKAAQEGNLGEYLGRGFGSAAVNIGGLFVPGAEEAEAAGAVGRLGEASEVAGRAGDVAEAAGGAEHVAQPLEDLTRSAASEPPAAAGSSTALQTYWPPNRGFQGAPVAEELGTGTRVDRYGYEGGTFLSPEGTPHEMRSLAPGTTSKPYNIYEVAKPIEVQSGTVAPWFGQIGQGIQYELPMPVSEAIANGYLKRVGP